MARTIAEERIPARMPTEVYNRLVEAAQTMGATLNQFLVQSALEKANQVLQQERTIQLSNDSAKALFDLLEEPPAPNQKLLDAMQRRKTALCSE